MSNLTTSDKVDSFMQQTVTALSATTALLSNKVYTGAITTRTVTLPASPLTGEQIIFEGTAAAETVITWPGSKVRQVGGAGYTTSTTFAIGNVSFCLEFDGTDWYLTDSSAPVFGRLTFDASASNMTGGQVTLASGLATVSNTAITINSIVTFGLRTSSGTVAGFPYAVLNAGTGFSVAGAGSGDNSTYNYHITYIQP